ncbi:3'-5' exoribonuclease YhaM [Polystyrenella longa]|uniref:3'-5' exoribonuclease YhaM n=1 Tax=Polystyrenella longa TaxID=2528007 RepID=A0A518CPV9_9PLAN|nr:HD domain-containing protein [Polystyrenella longa]QDU81261.1 3'-5' exoribonuclease YhaM [Polystyrenella longa]
MPSKPTTRPLSELENGEKATCYALLSQQDQAKTRDGKPYYRVTFRDREREAVVMVWSDSPWFGPCEAEWQVGSFYRITGQYADTKFGPQITLEEAHAVTDEDREAGFNENDFYISSRYNADEMFQDLLGIVEKEIVDPNLNELVRLILTENEEEIKTFPAAKRNHHAYLGGFLEHVRSVTQTALFLADKYADYYRAMQPPLSRDLVIAGAILHDIGKMQELAFQPQGSEYSPAGQLIGHILLGRDIVRSYAEKVPELDPNLLLRLEHIIVAHQNLPEWGSPIAPHTPEALLVHYADDIDAKYHMMAMALEADDNSDLDFTSRNNPLRRALFRG